MMQTKVKVLVSTEHKFLVDSNGGVWTPTSFEYRFWQRYLKIFDEVIIVARARKLCEVRDELLRVDGDRVRLLRLPLYQGFSDFMVKIHDVRSALIQAAKHADVAILRVGSSFADVIIHHLRKRAIPYGLEVVGDPWDVFGPGAIQHPLRPFMRRWFAWRLRKQCLMSDAVSYVTQRALQKRYPPGSNAYATHYSSLDLPDSAFRDTPKRYMRRGELTRIITVASLERMYKGVDTLIKAIAICRDNQFRCTLDVVGGGRNLDKLKRLAKECRVDELMRFHGSVLGGEAVIHELDQCDVFVLASRQEGLPRAMIEAMARGMPCIGTCVGGVGELIGEREMVHPDDPLCLANKIMEICGDQRRMRELAGRNLSRAQEYRENALAERRNKFYSHIRSKAEQSRLKVGDSACSARSQD